MAETRIEAIERLLEEIKPLNEEKIFIEAKLEFNRSNFFNSPSSEKSEIEYHQNKLNQIIEKLTPLFSELRRNQRKYTVQYKGQFSNPINNTTYWETIVEDLFLKTEVDIDTFNNGWEPYTTNTEVKNLISEIYYFLHFQRFTNFQILNVKSI